MKVKILKIRLSEEFQNHDEQQLNRFLRQHEVIKITSSMINGNESFWSVIIFYDAGYPAVNEKKTKYSADPQMQLNPNETKILDSLRLWRNEKAKQQNLPSYFIASNTELLSIAKFKPAKKEELSEIKGFGRHKIENYGTEIIRLLESI